VPHRPRTALLLTLPAIPALSALAQPAFTGIGDLAGGATASEAYGISADGTKVVGSGTPTDNLSRAVLWSAGTLTVLTDASGVYRPAAARAIAANGVIVGQAAGPGGLEAFKYNTGGANRFRALGGTTPGGTVGSSALGVAASGSLVVGTRENAGGALEAVRWDGPSITGLGWLPGGSSESQALGVSSDGSVIVGVSDTPAGSRAFALRASGMTPLESPGGGESEAVAASANGGVIVGSGTGPGYTHALRWTASGTDDLGVIPGGFNYSIATGCSADGSTVVGRTSSPLGTLACVWYPGRGPMLIQTVLANAGVASVAGWELTTATGISADGSRVCGTGVNPAGLTEGWVATLPPAPPPACPADFNGDAFVDFFDYADYVGCFESGSCPPGTTADFNGDGFADFFDYADFVAAFESGC
jgi:uncharacterized membrane protein